MAHVKVDAIPSGRRTWNGTTPVSRSQSINFDISSMKTSSAQSDSASYATAHPQPLSVYESLTESSSDSEPTSPALPPIPPKWVRPKMRRAGSSLMSATRITMSRRPTEDDMAQLLTIPPRKFNNITKVDLGTDQKDTKVKELDKRMEKIFGRARQKQSEEDKTRHLGVIFKNVTVKGQALGDAIQPTLGDVFLGVPRMLSGLVGGWGAEASPNTKTILNKFTGCIKPGEMLLVLGRPGSGVSTFLKVIANQRNGFKSVHGRVSYGGESAETMGTKYRSEVLYNPEADLHCATLKVKDTLRFALQSRAPAPHSRTEGETQEDYVREFFQMATKVFWIEHTMNTIVGNEYKRGVSGGEKKRVSIAEALVTKASTQCWDDPTRGLDSSAALEYVRILRSMTNTARMATAVGLYQASEDMWDHFDKVLLIDGGECCYYGPTHSAVQYFKDLGFEVPDRCTSADFLTSLSSEHQRKIRPGFEDYIPRNPWEFAEAWRASDQRSSNLMDIWQFESKLYSMMEKRSDAQSSATKTKNYALPFWKQVWILARRQALVLKGDPQTLAGKWGGVLFQAIIIGSLFFKMPKTSDGVFLRGGVLFFMLLFNALLALAELTPAFEARPLLIKHKSFSFYRPAAYAIAQTLLDIPLLFIQVTLFNVIVYFMSGLQRTVAKFLITNVFLYVLTMTVYAAFRAIGATAPSLDAATRLTGLGMQALVVYTDYIIPPKKMKVWLAWLRWLNPIQYCFESLMVNEFDGLDIQCVGPNLIPQGPGVQPQFQSCTVQGSRPGASSVSGKDYLEVSFGFRKSHLWRNLGIILAFLFFFVAVTAVGMEYQGMGGAGQAGSGVTMFKRDQRPRKKRVAMQEDGEGDDEESDDDSDDESASKKPYSKESAEKAPPPQPTFTWRNVEYTIPYDQGTRRLLQNVQGYVKPGKLTALMGSSGAGKTTLLNVLAQRIRFGVVTGEFRVDGHPLPSSFQRSTGFAEQMDVHEPTQTMRDIAGAVIGSNGTSLNQEQRKRLTIAVELASRPQLLIFLDEPTSGLDSLAAANLVRLLRKLADAGQAILCTIHQPSAILFDYFDYLLLLKRGGRMVYFGELGPGSRVLIDYLERNGAPACPPKANPAEYMLDAIGAGNPNQQGSDWADIWSRSPENARLTLEIEDLVRTKGASSRPRVDDAKYAMPLRAQISAVVYRSFSSMWRSRDYVMGVLLLHVFVGLFSTFSFWMLGNSMLNMQSRLFAVFMTLIIAPPLMQQLQPRFLEARNLYAQREAKARIYSWFAFVTGAVVCEIPYRILAGTLYWLCWYFGIGFPRRDLIPFKIWMLIVLYELFYLGLGQGIAAFSPSEALASFFIPLFFMFVIAFCGIAVPFFALPHFWKWMYHVTPFTYLLEAMLGLVVHNVPVVCSQDELALIPPPPNSTCNQYMGAYVKQAGGYVQTLPDGFCGYCQFATGDQFAVGFNVFERHFWRDSAIFGVYVVFNFVFIYACSWFYLQGYGQIKSFFSREKKKEQSGSEYV
ncbi:abc drug exporter [Pyrenophora seminiperda CCB06]|uniref:Abc drug exporter n=1 Tax=Pyrenophora seminiperda CCB06 TaxID=1302712 RepID=A0A3M7M435_9PLEO|nr:abc drug exporter [Pyrenophora seminiperda CCB06]